ncbi:MAG: response regulator [Oscillatoriales cyanobacterium SM2_2_1]|nr:response regulator [Oscillatoriales cyanobacterium SM2_2_1]
MNSLKLLKRLTQASQRFYLITTVDGCLVEFSPEAVHYAEHSEAMAIGNDVRDCFPELVGLGSVFEQIVAHDLDCFEMKNLQREKLYFDLSLFAVQEPGSGPRIFSLIEDVTDRAELAQQLLHRANELELITEALAASQEFIHKIIWSMGDGMLVTDARGVIRLANRVALDWWEQESSNLIGKALDDVFGDRPIFASLVVHSAENACSEVSLLTPAGQELTIRFSAATVWMPREHQHNYIFVGRDVTELRRKELEVEEAIARAEHSAQIKSLFLANMSHEIRTPMNGILGMTELLLEMPLTVEQRDYVSSIHTCSSTLLGLLNQILELSRLESGGVELEVMEFSPLGVVEEVVELLATSAHRKGVELIAAVPIQGAQMVVGDLGRLRQILFNLVGNAIKFTNQGYVLVRIHRQEGESREFTFEVIDTGIGIPLESQERIFETFSQVDASTTRRYGGTGLGLSICRQLVSLMGGTIGVDSPLGPQGGSRFWAQLPFRPVSLAPEEIPQWFAGRSLLLVDGQELVIASIAQHLVPRGMTVYCARTADEALAILDRCPIPPSFGLVEMSALESGMLGQWFSQHQVPLIAMLRSTQRQAELENLPHVDQPRLHFLYKPIRLNRLLRLLRELLQGAGGDPDITVPLFFGIDGDSEASPPLTHGAEILLVEDNPVNQKVAVRQLNRLGYTVDAVGDGESALNALSQHAYQLVLMDCQMPVLDGFMTTERIRQWEQATGREPLAIIALTANTLPEDRDRCLQAGMNGYLSKPLSRQELADTIDRWLPRDRTQ